MDMEIVNVFNGEMMSMMDMSPPISRAKMMSVTKAGIKAIRLYKHVVQIVEKFIKRCKPELKVAGLYVVDSIIRQSRHQFGTDKDVFGPRFLRNFNVTFQNLFQCPDDDKVKILRVLCLWQKNEMFGMEVIQPLLDMATAPELPVLENGVSVIEYPLQSMEVPVHVEPQHPEPTPAATTATTFPSIQTQMPLTAFTQLLQGTGNLELQQLLQLTGGMGLPQPTAPPKEQKPSLAKSLLDRFDYDDEPEPVEEKPEPAPAPVPAAPITINLPPELQQALQAHLLSQIANQTQGQVHGSQSHAPLQDQVPLQPHVAPQDLTTMVQTSMVVDKQSCEGHIEEPSSTKQLQESTKPERPVHDEKDRKHSRRSRSRSPRKPSSRTRRSRSDSRSRRDRSRRHRTRSRSRERSRHSPRSRSEERRNREKERERRQRGFPSYKKETLSVCTTTLWIGQLDKKTNKQDIMMLMEEFGQIESINMIPPRGCAYVVMVHRQDACTALNKLNRGFLKVSGKVIKIAWAMNKGIKTELKKYWDGDRGVTYIPWEKVNPDEIQCLQDGGVLDLETLKSEWRATITNLEGSEAKEEDGAAQPMVSQSPPLHLVQPVQVAPPIQPFQQASAIQLPPPLYPCAQPVQLIQPANPVHPNQLPPPVQLSQTVHPSQQVQLIQPNIPIHPSQQVQLIQPANPVHLSQPGQVIRPDNPFHYSQQGELIQPDNPVHVIQPDNPFHHCQQGQLIQPANPVHPNQQGRLTKPDNLVHPNQLIPAVQLNPPINQVHSSQQVQLIQPDNQGHPSQQVQLMQPENPVHSNQLASPVQLKQPPHQVHPIRQANPVPLQMGPSNLLVQNGQDVIPGQVTPNMSLPPRSLITGTNSPPFSPRRFTPPQMPPVFPPNAPMAPGDHHLSSTETDYEDPAIEDPDSPDYYMEPPGPLLPVMRPRLLRPRMRLPTSHPPQFQSNRPQMNIPPQNLPPRMMPSRGTNPMFNDSPVGRIRMPRMRPPGQELIRHRFPRGPRGEEPHWRELGPERIPENYDNGPRFQRGGWRMGRPRMQSRFGS